MVVSASRERLLAPSQAARRAPQVLWHEVECGVYSADLPLWRELAGAAERQWQGASILEIGAGTGRVSLDLAGNGHSVTALEIEADLLIALRERAGEAHLETVCADARSFDLSRRDFALCIVAMQTLQLLRGAQERMSFLRRARAHLRPGGLLACAIVTDLEPFDCAAGDAGPSAELARFDGELYMSRATRVSVRAGSIEIERERRMLRPGSTGAQRAGEIDVVELARVGPRELEQEGISAGFAALPLRAIAATTEHVGSSVVMLRA